jgi:2-dehydropantoate 2-reductase
MLQDVEQKRRTEIDVINGAILEAGRARNIPTPANEVTVQLIKALETSFN